MKQAVCVGCGGEFTVRADRRAKFCTVACSNRSKAGANHWLYAGGLAFDPASGRWRIMCRDGTQVYFYRAVMEAHVKRPLRPDEIVHHRNGDPADDRIENLELTTRAGHIEMHRAELRSAA